MPVDSGLTVNVSVDANKFLNDLLQNVLETKVLGLFQRHITQRPGSGGSLWEWRLTVDGKGIDNGKKQLVSAVGNLILKILKEGRDYMLTILEMGGRGSVNNFGVVLSPLDKKYLERKERTFGNSHFMNQSDRTWSSLISSEPTFTGESGGIYNYSWELKGSGENYEKWEAFNFGTRRGQRARPAYKIYQNWIDSAVINKISRIATNEAGSFEDLANMIQRVAV